ncbi:MAG: MMPL family transporter [Candidatus Thiodiazotropha sp. (ex Lucinoma kastoroae)]|nr:MMPL family transporter [Candidatus Thiodiazotropha sp. (ex Rostrolucina anterorostrata)]MCU7849895.1 MMPL family transporter [Candidatus Thiodiazotropha sp. (ex Lucinoma kastoroae)]
MARAKWFVLLAVILVIATLRLTQVRTDINDFLFTGKATDSAFLVGRMQSDELSRRYLISLTHPGVDSQKVFDFILAFQQELTDHPTVARVWSGKTADDALEALIELYLPYRIHLFSLVPEDTFTRLFTPESLDEQAVKIKQALLGPDPMLVNSLIAKDPMLLTLNWLSQVEQRMQHKDMTGYSSLFIETHSSGTDIAVQDAFQQELRGLFQRLEQQIGSGISMEFTGISVFAVAIKHAVSADIQRVSSLSLFAIVLLFLWVFRSLRALIAVALLMAATVSVAVLTTGWLFGFVHGLTLALGSTLIGVCIDYPIHAMVHAGQGDSGQRSSRISLIWPAMIIGGATTVIGYMALGFSGFPGLQQLAVFSAAGILTALLLTRFVLPDLMNLLAIDMRPRLSVNWLLDPPGRTWLLRMIFVISIVSLLLGISQLHWSTDLATLSPALEELKSKDQMIRSHLVSMEPGRFILAEGDTLEQALQNSERLQGRLEQLRQQGELENYFPIFPWLASAELQLRNEKAWNKKVTVDAQQAFNRALAREGLAAKAFPPLSPSSVAPLEQNALRNSQAWPLISNQLLQIGNKFATVVWLGRHDTQKVRAVTDELPQVNYFSQKDSMTALTEQYRERAQSMLLLGLLAILLLLFWRYRSLLQALRVLLPAAVSLLVVTAGWSLAAAPMGMLHLVGLLLAAAICVDYGIFFMENRGGSRQLTIQAIATSAFTSAISFSCLGVAETPALHALALTVAPGVLLGFLLCPVMLDQQNSGRIAAI